MIIISPSLALYGYYGYLAKDFQIKQPYWYTLLLFHGVLNNPTNIGSHIYTVGMKVDPDGVRAEQCLTKTNDNP